MKNSRPVFLILYFLCLAPPVHAQDEWKTKAHVNVGEPGIVETVLPPELYLKKTGQNLDLDLIGPDGHPRSFELYWREHVGRTNMELLPLGLIFEKDTVFIWEGKTPQPLQADHITINISDDGFVGRVDVEALGTDGWKDLKKGEAIFRSRGQTRNELDIEKGIYEKIRLRFTGFDKKYKQTFVPIHSVTLSGEKPGKDYIEKTITPDFEQSETDGITEIRVILPGSGLWLQSLRLTTQAQFQGSWKIGTEKIDHGKQTFVPIQSGIIDHVSKEKQSVTFMIDKEWPGRNFIIKLNPRGMYFGAVTNLDIQARLLRMVFLADKKGSYTALAGTGKSVAVYLFPGDLDRHVDQLLSFSDININGDWRPETLVEKYAIKGGPFNDDGFGWRSKIDISESGYYRLPLNLEASHEKNRNGIRLVKDDIQIPFFWGIDEKKEIDLTLSTTSDYHPDGNKTILTISLPYASAYWSNLDIYATGIFKREINIDIPKPGNIGWQQWMTRTWESRTHQESKFLIDLKGFSSDRSKIRVTIDHGDNQPLRIDKISASYSSPTIHFLAHEPGVYMAYGGNPDSPFPDYDLSLVQSDLLENLPKDIEMTKIEPFRSGNWKKRINYFFKDTGWGLYAALGLVTIVLLFLIVKLLPKVEKKE